MYIYYIQKCVYPQALMMTMDAQSTLCRLAVAECGDYKEYLEKSESLCLVIETNGGIKNTLRTALINEFKTIPPV